MIRLYHYGLVVLLTVILVAFLLLFTDVTSSGDHLTIGNTWTVKSLRFSAYWRDSLSSKDIHNRSESANYVPPKNPHQNKYLSSVKSVNVLKKKQALGRTHGGENKSIVSSSISTTTQPSYGTDTMSVAPYHHQSSDPISKKTNKYGRKKSFKKNVSMTPDVLNLAALTETENANVEEVDSEQEEMLATTLDDEKYAEIEYPDDITEEMEEKEAEIIKQLFSKEMENQSVEVQMTTPLLQRTMLNTNRHLNPGINPSLKALSTEIHFHMPCPKVYRPVREIMMASWMKPLLRILSSFKGKQVTLVIANNAYRDVLLNWLISAKVASNPPIENIIVVSLDHILYELLQSRDIPSIVAPFSSLLNTNHRFRRFFELIMMMRLGFMRLINRLGYDCAMYDIDAIILKNPQPLYDKYADMDIIGSRGELPRQLWRRWGVAICIGAVFIRGNSRTELYWEAMHSARIRGAGMMANDQIRLNYGLQALDIQWERSRQDNIKLDSPALGHSSSSNLSVAVLPFSTICRFGCRADLRDKYYIWHKGGSRDKKSKMKGAKQGHTWFLKDRWSEIHSNMVIDVKGTKWLKRISVRV